MFTGFVSLGSNHVIGFLVKNSSGTPLNADALPTFRAYGPNGYLGYSGTAAFLNSGSITGATNASPIVITSASHALVTGNRVTITGVGGNTAANGTFIVTLVDSNSFSLDGSTGNGAYTSGGTWSLTGGYKLTVAATAGNSFAADTSYSILVNYAISAGTQQGQIFAMAVV